ncbi:unnamed protein product, partial [Adineta steineri]
MARRELCSFRWNGTEWATITTYSNSEFDSKLYSLNQQNTMPAVNEPIRVCTDGHLILEYTFDDLMRIKSWHFAIKQFRELIPRSIVAIPADNPGYLDQLSKNLTRSGLTSVMLNFLRLCEILEPMQELMSRHKTTTFSPRDCLKTILHQRWSKTCSEIPLSPSFQTTLPCQTVLAT